MSCSTCRHYTEDKDIKLNCLWHNKTVGVDDVGCNKHRPVSDNRPVGTKAMQQAARERLLVAIHAMSQAIEIIVEPDVMVPHHQRAIRLAKEKICSFSEMVVSATNQQQLSRIKASITILKKELSEHYKALGMIEKKQGKKAEKVDGAKMSEKELMDL